MNPPTPESLRPHYSAFLRDDRILLTGHSHQAWPDVARAGLLEAFADAAGHVDDKWGRATAKADRLRAHIAARIGAAPEEIALGQNTHELLCRFLSALDLRARPHLLSTRGEFHSVDRQLARLGEAGVEVERIDPAPVATLAGRLAARVRPNTAAVLVSTVLFRTAAIVPGLAETVAAAQKVGAHVFLDAYHGFDAVPFTVADFGADPVFVSGGGYKYAQWGEGCCWLRVPPEPALRPVLTGWFSDFANLEKARAGGPVGYGPTPAARFAGSTYDPASHYRAVAVADFFEAQGLEVAALRAVSRRQTGRLVDALSELELASPREAEARGGFVAFRVREAAAVVHALRARGVFADARGDLLRLGPAPYLIDAELDAGAAAVREALAERSAGAGRC